MRYLRGTIKYGITYGAVKGDLTGYSDADWAANLDERKSTTGYVFTMNGGAISWNSRKQPTVALSSTEAEYMAVVTAIQEAIWLRGFYTEIFGKNTTTSLYSDNKGAIQVMINNSYSTRTKHIDIKAGFVREKLRNEELQLKYIRTENMPADILTKAVTRAKMTNLTPNFGLNPILD